MNRKEFSTDLSGIKRQLKEKMKFLNPSLFISKSPNSPKKIKPKIAHISFRQSVMINSYDEETIEPKRKLHEIVTTAKGAFRSIEKKQPMDPFSHDYTAKVRDRLKNEFLINVERLMKEKNSNKLIKGNKAFKKKIFNF
jgi:hypothetical protein